MSTYTIRKNGAKLLDEYRGDRIYGDCFVILKDDVETYEVVTSTIVDYCNCPGFVNHGKCKHIAMVLEYRKHADEQFPSTI